MGLTAGTCVRYGDDSYESPVARDRVGIRPAYRNRDLKANSAGISVVARCFDSPDRGDFSRMLAEFAPSGYRGRL